MERKGRSLRDSLAKGGVRRVGKKEHRSGLFPLGPGVFLPLSVAGKVGVEPLVAQDRVGNGRVEIVQIELGFAQMREVRDYSSANGRAVTLGPG